MRLDSAWLYLFLGTVVIVWAVGLKYTEGFSRLWASIATVCAMITSFALRAQVLNTIPVGGGTCYKDGDWERLTFLWTG